MTTDDAVRTRTDPWGRPIENDGPVFGTLDGDPDAWPTTPMCVLDQEDLVTCAARFARGYASEYFFTIWFFCLDEDGWTTKDIAELLDLPPTPPADVVDLLAHVAREMEEMAPGTSVLAALASPDGGDRGAREESWTQALLDSTAVTGMRIRGIVAVGAHRARVLYDSTGSGGSGPR